MCILSKEMKHIRHYFKHILSPKAIATCLVMMLLSTLITFAQVSQGNFISHHVQAGETAYSISKRYGISLSTLMTLNPSTQEGVKVGEVLRIPVSASKQLQHVVQKGETLYSLSRRYEVSVVQIMEANNLSSPEDLSIGMTLNIPAKTKPSEDAVPSVSRIVSNDNLKVGVLLPFIDENNTYTSRLVEYLQGVLLALEEFKKNQGNANVYIFNIEPNQDTQRLNAILETAEFKNLDLLIGGISSQQINVLSQFAKKQQIAYVVPLSSRCDDLDSNPYLFQINPPQTELYELVADIFIHKFKQTNILIVNDNAEQDVRNNKEDLINTLKRRLRQQNMPFHEVDINQVSFDELTQMTLPYMSNTIIPAFSSASSILKIVDKLQGPMGDDIPDNITLFGYPEWQTYTSLENTFKTLNTYFYSTFYADDSLSNVAELNYKFQEQYGKPMLKTYPRFGLLGYDTAKYFLEAIKHVGRNPQAIANYSSSTLQMPLHFYRKSSSSGYLNVGLLLINNAYGEVTTQYFSSF